MSQVSYLSNLAATVVDAIKLLDVKRVISGLSPHIAEYVNRNASIAASLRTMPIVNVGDNLTTMIKQDYDNMMTLLSGGLGDSVGSMYSILYETLNGTNVLLNSYLGLIQRVGIDPYISRWVNSTIQPNIPDARLAWFMHNVNVIDDDSYKAYMAQNGWSDNLRQLLEMAWIAPLPVPMIFDLRRRGLIDVETSKDMLAYHGYVGVMNSWIDSLTIQMPEPYRTADFAAKRLISDDYGKKAFTWFGLDDTVYNAWKQSQMISENFAQAAEERWRGLIDDAAFDAIMARGGFEAGTIMRLKSLLEQIPPSGDLVTMVVREAFEEKYVVPAPEVFAKYMAMKGFTKEWSDRYWTMHFLFMPIQYGYANLHRGYWGKDQFLELLRIADIHPKWREDIYNVAFNPPSIREMGYGYDVGVYSVEDIVRFRRWGGLSEADAAKAGQAMVAYRTEAEREAVRRDYLHLYVNGNIEREDFKTALETIGTVPEGVPLWLERGDLEIELKSTETSITEPKNITRSDAQWLFENGLRDETFLRDTLKNLGYLEGSIDAYVDQSKKRIADKAAPKPPAEPRKLTLANIQRLLNMNMIDANEAVAKVISLNYTESDAKLIVQIMLDTLYPMPEPRMLTDSHITSLYSYNLVSEVGILAHFKAEGYSDADARLLTQLAVITKNLPDLTDMYSKGWIDQNTLFEGVKALGIPMEAVEPSQYPALSKLIEVIGLPDEKAKRIMLTIVKAEQPARVAAEKELTKAEIVKGVKVGVISPVEGASLLEGLGYSEDEAYYILAINKVISAGDPEGYWEMRRVIELQKKARGEKYVDIPQELIVLERQRRELLANLNKLKADKATEEAIGEAAVRLANVEAQIHTLIAKLKLS
jgi:hypothetical protein